VPPGGICVTADEAAKLAAQIGFPVALKLTSRTIVHKTEFGGVRLNLDSEAAVHPGTALPPGRACQIVDAFALRLGPRLAGRSSEWAKSPNDHFTINTGQVA
jgi:hypothetical protein